VDWGSPLFQRIDAQARPIVKLSYVTLNYSDDASVEKVGLCVLINVIDK
jgi:hypothetical protein